MGLAYGKLMKNELPPMIDQFFDWAAIYIENNISVIISKLPLFMKDWIGKTGVTLARGLLDLNHIITYKYTPRRFEDEMRGISDGSGISV